MDYDILVGLANGLLPLLGGLIALISWQNSQFSRLASKIKAVQHEQVLKDAKIEGKLDSYELRINGNRELIEHRTNRMLESDKQLYERLAKDIEANQKSLEQIRRYLEKSGFNRREG